ncbi:MotA/TolQ/ExbB proton channel family protein [Vibrio genomosp. F10 str. 9ZC157]|nr:MotA/TolQ/ExbB proton channel family protein [Vibrio genomosp. F10]
MTIKGSASTRIDQLDNTAQKLAYKLCVLESKKNGQFAAVKYDRVLIKKPLEQAVPLASLTDLKSVPAMLTTLGILGTFTGISVGLYELGSGWDEVSQLANQAKKLLAGMKTAFFTSIAGMGASGIIMLCLTLVQSKFNKMRQESIARLEGHVQTTSPNELLHSILDQAKSSESVQTDFTELTQALLAITEKPDAITATEFEAISQRISAGVENKINALESTVENKLVSLEKAQTNSINQIPKELSAQLNSLVTQPINSQLMGMGRELEQSNSALTTIAQMMEEQHESLQSEIQVPTLEDIKQVLVEVTEPLVTVTNKSNGVLSSIAASTFESNQHLVDATSGINKVDHGLEQLVLQTSTTNMTLDSIKSTAIEAQENVQKSLITIDKNTAQVTDVVSGIKAVSHGIVELSKSRDKEFDVLVYAMREQIVKPITAELSQTNKVVHEFAQVSDKLNNSVAKTVEEMAKATSTIENFEQETLAKLNDFAGSMDKSLNEFAVNSTKALNSITSEVQGIVKLGNESIKEQTQAFSSMVSDSEIIFKDQAATLSNVGKESASLMSSAKHELVEGLGDIDNKVLGMSRTIQTELATFRDEYQQNLTTYFEEQNNALEKSLESQKDGLNQVVQNFAGVFKEEYDKRSQLITDLNTQYAQLVDSTTRIQSMAKAIGLDRANSLSELQLHEQTLGRQVRELNTSFTKASEEFIKVAANMKPEMDDYFTRANKGVAEYFTSFDEVSSRIYTRLDRAAELFITAKEEADEAALLAEKERSVVEVN